MEYSFDAKEKFDAQETLSVMLKLPLQAPPVQRAVASGPLSRQSGVDPSVDWDAVAAAAGTFLTGLASLMGGG